MTDQENQALDALSELLEMTDASDWHLLHQTVRTDVASGKYTREFETAYKAMVNAKQNKNPSD